jgi:hypothetical protein
MSGDSKHLCLAKIPTPQKETLPVKKQFRITD